MVDKRDLTDKQNAVVVYHNPYDNIDALAHLFFKRCLEAKITPYIVTKKTVFKWQEPFWANMKKVFDETYKEDFVKVSFFYCNIYGGSSIAYIPKLNNFIFIIFSLWQAGLMEECGGELQHLISDAATMKLIRWTHGGFGTSFLYFLTEAQYRYNIFWWPRPNAIFQQSCFHFVL